MMLPHGWLHVIKSSKVDVCLLLEFCQLIMERGSVLISIHLDQWHCCRIKLFENHLKADWRISRMKRESSSSSVEEVGFIKL